MATEPSKPRRRKSQPQPEPDVIGIPAPSMAIVAPVEHQLTDAAPLAAPAEAKGIECPRCGCRHFNVYYTRPGFGGVIRRSRSCRHCGRRVITTERVQGS